MLNNQKELILLKDLGMLYTSETKKYKARFGLYKCFCGNEFKAQIQDVKNKKHRSCGCEKGNKKHNLSEHRLFKVWYMMIDRCTNQNNKAYKYYGAMGITVCAHWLNPENFINDMFPTYQEGLSIDRIDNNKGYFKSNCRWATKNTQSRNTRKLMSTNTSGYRGVTIQKNKNKYQAIIGLFNSNVYLGAYITALEAAKAYDNYIIANNLEHTRNFS